MSITDPALALGLTGIADWGTSCPFIDHMKFSRAWFASGPVTATGAQTNAAGYAIGATTITLASAGTGAFPVNSVITFASDPAIIRYLVTGGDADVSNGGS